MDETGPVATGGDVSLRGATVGEDHLTDNVTCEKRALWCFAMLKAALTQECSYYNVEWNLLERSIHRFGAAGTSLSRPCSCSVDGGWKVFVSTFSTRMNIDQIVEYSSKFSKKRLKFVCMCVALNVNIFNGRFNRYTKTTFSFQ